MSGNKKNLSGGDVKEIEKKLDDVAGFLNERLPELVENMERIAENNLKFVALLQENVRNQNDNMNYLEKKLEYIEKTIELKTKHFDEIIKKKIEGEEDLVKLVQASLHSQGNLLEHIEKNITSVKYWFLVVLLVISSLIWGINSHFFKKGLDNRESVKELSVDFTGPDALQETMRAINTLKEENKESLLAIQREVKNLTAEQEKKNAEQLKAVQEENKRFFKKMQLDNHDLLSAIQQSNQENLTSILNIIRTSPAKTSSSDEQTLVPQKNLEDGEEGLGVPLESEEEELMEGFE